MKFTKYDYELNDIIKSLLDCNIKAGDNVYISGNLFNFEYCKIKNRLLI